MGDEVVLHIYDLSMGMARTMSPMLLGRQIDILPHTGIVLRGREYFYGGGIQVLPPHHVVEYFGLPPVEKVVLGRTTTSENELRDYLRSISSRFTMYAYDLFTNNCNNFTDEVAKFLVGTGIPDRILKIPQDVLATPMGPMIRQMMSGMQENMYQRLGTNDPFTALAAERGQAPVATPAAPAPASANSAHVPAASSILPTSVSPLLSTQLGNVSAITARLLKIGPALQEDSRLTANETVLLERLPGLLQSPNAHTEPICEDGMCYLPDTQAIKDWQSVANLLSNMMKRWPRAQAGLALLFLARVLVLREDASTYLYASGGLVDQVYSTAVSEGDDMFGSRPTNVMAMSVLANVLGTPAGRAWAMATEDRRDKLVQLAVKFSRADQVEMRQMAAALAYNLCNALPVGSNTAGPTELGVDVVTNTGAGHETLPVVSTAPGDATVLITDASVQLMCALLENVSAESDNEVVRRRLLGVGRLVIREGPAAGELLATLDLDDALTAITQDDARPTELRALAAEVQQLIRKSA